MVLELDDLLSEADGFFMGRSKLHEAARRLAKLLDEMGIPYAIARAMALMVHGRRRLTEDVDVLLRPEDLARFKKEWLGRGYVEITPGMKAVRDTQNGVRIDFLLTGDFPGDGKPKPVSFPDPAGLGIEGEGFKVLGLEKLIELKLASGVTAPHRGQDLVDVMELIRARKLDREYAGRLDDSVQPEYERLWTLAQIQDDY
jgi:hypothetical protein